MRAAVAQRNPEWAAALAEDSRSADLIEVLAPADRERFVLRHLPIESDTDFAGTLALAATPWSAAVADAVLDRLVRPVPEKSRGPGLWLPHDATTAFPVAAAPRIRVLLDDPPETNCALSDERHRKMLRTALSFHAFDRSIRESFS
ncbi:MAG: hypothetical protein QM658_00875 [Gordonia sp. (in: high G+C Gram-positive bacteria)]